MPAIDGVEDFLQVELEAAVALAIERHVLRLAAH